MPGCHEHRPTQLSDRSAHDTPARTTARNTPSLAQALSGGNRVPLMGWSAEVGDLRLPDFLATHAIHAITLIVGRTAHWATATGVTALTLWCFARALSGLPPF